MKKSILVIVESISRRSGGTSSALDLIEAFSDLGYDVNIGVVKYPPLFYKLFMNNFLKISLDKIKFIDNRIIKERLKSRMRLLFTKLIFQKIKKDNFKSYEYVIDISVLDEMLVSEFRNGNTIFVKNHAGSVESFKKSFSNIEEHSRKSYLNSFKNYDRILFQSKSQSLECLTEFKDLKGKPIVIEPSCEEENVLKALFSKSPYQNESTKLTLVNVGSIQKRKGQILSVRLINELIKSGIDCILHLVGGISDNDYLNEIRKEAEIFGIKESLVVHGHKDNYLDFMAHSDIILQTSYSEGVSRILREAMLMEKPIATFSISGTKDLLDDECAILSEPFNEKVLSEKIEILINDKKKLSAMKKAALNKYITNNCKTVYYKKILSEFK